MLVATFALSITIGVSLGMLGGGGSMLTVPILTYVAGMDAKAAIASSLFVVAVTSAAGAIAHARAGRVRWRTGVVFGAAGMSGAFLGGRIAAYLPARMLMVAFAVVMAGSALAMLRGPRVLRSCPDLDLARALGFGLAIGAVSGLVGAGGGFLVVPSLVLLGGLPIELAVGTSLVVIAMSSLAGFLGHLDHAALNWPVTLGVTAMAVVGSVVGGRLALHIASATLRRAFGVFLASMAAWILVAELA